MRKRAQQERKTTNQKVFDFYVTTVLRDRSEKRWRVHKVVVEEAEAAMAEVEEVDFGPTTTVIPRRKWYLLHPELRV